MGGYVSKASREQPRAPHGPQQGTLTRKATPIASRFRDTQKLSAAYHGTEYGYTLSSCFESLITYATVSLT